MATDARPYFLVSTEACADDPIRLDGPEGHHAVRVRRLRVGEEVALTDGAGRTAFGTVTELGRDWLDVQVTERLREEAPTPTITVVQALAKGDRGEVAVETLTEVGVDRIVPWQASRSIATWTGERAAKGVARWTATSRSAAKQARRSHWPTVTDVAGTLAVADLIRSADLAVVLHERGGEPLAALTAPNDGVIVLVVGPEGGISPEELDVFLAAGARQGRLGPSVLRTSTAGTVAAGVLLAGTSRWA